MTLAQNRARPVRKASEGVADLVITGGLAIAVVMSWAALIWSYGWSGFMVGWVVSPFVGVIAALLLTVWTIPLRRADVLSFRRRTRISSPDEANAAVRSIVVVMPVFNAEPFLQLSLPPLMAMVARGQLKEVLVVDDGSTDDSAAFARAQGAKVVGSGGRKGPGAARNLAIKHAEADVLWFVDADVVVHEDSAVFIQEAFAHPDVVATFGSYDDRPAAPNFGSQYKNLVHHHYHQHADAVASTFWSGCGAVKTSAFAAVGGFDAETYRFPSVEDVDLGYRLREGGGTIRLDRRLLSTHLKVWSILELVRVDIFRRAIPWARMMLKRAELLDDLNVGTVERLRAILAGVAVLSILAVIVGMMSPLWLLPIFFTVLTANWHLFRLFAGRQGMLFAICGLAFHQIYYLYSGVAFVCCWLEYMLGRVNSDGDRFIDESLAG